MPNLSYTPSHRFRLALAMSWFSAGVFAMALREWLCYSTAHVELAVLGSIGLLFAVLSLTDLPKRATFKRRMSLPQTGVILLGPTAAAAVLPLSLYYLFVLEGFVDDGPSLALPVILAGVVDIVLKGIVDDWLSLALSVILAGVAVIVVAARASELPTAACGIVLGLLSQVLFYIKETIFFSLRLTEDHAFYQMASPRMFYLAVGAAIAGCVAVFLASSRRVSQGVMAATAYAVIGTSISSFSEALRWHFAFRLEEVEPSPTLITVLSWVGFERNLLPIVFSAVIGLVFAFMALLVLRIVLRILRTNQGSQVIVGRPNESSSTSR